MKTRIRNPVLLALFLVPIIFTLDLVVQYQAVAQDKTNTQISPYYTVYTIILDGTSIDEVIINGPPTPPPGYVRPVVARLPEPNPAAGINVLSNVPAFNWSFGCSATSAAMIVGYYDRTAYPNMYTGPTNGGVMPMDNSSWPDWHDESAWRHQCPLSATHKGLDGRATNGHVDDYWVQYGSAAPDPFIGNWAEHAYGDCTGDYMKTNQSNYGNSDGSTTFWNYTNGAPYYWNQMEAAGHHTTDGGYGHKLFYESRGYTVTNMYNQYIQGQGSNPALGFTYAQYKAEIDAGRPVMIHVTGHTMVGLGYDDSANVIFIHDTWNYNTYTMTWGGSYVGMDHRGVTIVQLAEPEIDVRGIGNSIPNGDTTPSAADDTDYGNVNVGSNVSHTFTIHNTGAELLQLYGTPTVLISGAHWSDFAVTSQPSSTSLGPGGSTTFTVQFSPSAAGLRSARIIIGNTDLNEDPYYFDIQGTGSAVFRADRFGNVFADMDIHGQGIATGQADVAEWVPVSEPVEPGDVLELDPSRPGHYRKARSPCSTLVGGVVSTDPGVILGADAPSSSASGSGLWTDDSRLPTGDSRLATEGSALLALLGIVPVNVTDENGPIQPGDLLVVSSTAGHAMRWDPPQDGEACGLVGKALEPFDSGAGMIQMLLMR